MEEGDKGCPMIRMGVSGRTFLLVPAYPGSPGQKAVKRLCVCVCVSQARTNLEGCSRKGNRCKMGGGTVIPAQSEKIQDILQDIWKKIQDI